jgi:nucleoside 2-deoxyribosyltransferase
MNGDNVVVIVYRGDVVKIYSDNANVLATVVDLDDRDRGAQYIHTFEWPDTQFDEEEIRNVIGDKVRDFMN